MPHIELKTSPNLAANLNTSNLLNRLVATLATFETVTPSAIKAYQTQLLTHSMGQGAPFEFIHCTVSVLNGRPLELRQRMAKALHQVMKETPGLEEVAVSLELREMEAATYIK